MINHKHRKQKDPHIGGIQLPLITPPSNWQAPSSLPAPETLGEAIGIDSETKDNGLSAKRGPGWAHNDGHVCGVSIAWHGESEVNSLYAPIAHPDTQCFSKDQVADWLRAIQRRGIKMIFHNAPYDLGWLLMDLGVAPPRDGEKLEDTTAKSVMIDENRFSYALDTLLKWRALPGKDESLLREAAAAYGFHGAEVKKNIWRMAGRYAGPYAEQDAIGTLLLGESLDAQIDADGVRAAYRLECDLIPLVLEMRRRGIRVDIDAAHDALDLLHKSRDDALAYISKELKMPVSMDEIRNVSWMERVHDMEKINYPRTPKTQRGSFTAGKEGWMRKHPHWLPRTIAQAERYNDAADKFVQGFVLNYSHKGRIHATVNQFRSGDEDTGGTKGTRSHRFSYDNPPLQQMPERDDEIGPLVRGLFLPEEGQVWGAHDYSQQEYRIIVHGASVLNARRVEEAIRQYREDPKTDFHQLVVEWTGLDRKRAKDCNFGKAFGAGVKKFAHMIGRTEEEAAEIYEQYDRELPFVSEAARTCTQLASRRGYVRLIDGARCHFDFWEPARREDVSGYAQPMPLEQARAHWGEHVRLRRSMTHKAFNRYVQGSAARQTKMAMRMCWNEGYVPMLQMHDDLNFSHTSEEEGHRVATIMRDVVKLRVPMKVDSEYGRSWGTARTVEGYGATWAEAAALVKSSKGR